ncbi:DHHW family protein [Oceanidesulfovibrio marinus]|uniref:AlgX/AlgJ SGNH hydrolase-like domain-containing protein n=1 Tax=Oceanidesulfovibrio marinus TaxID=370038 RepID=A0A6P1ZGU3_9BACT|nr:DHHW family protein [Oceanidesulfovibrio marinus]TVM34058.1 hypothetical protein DQK91_09140 [Oceanidesulfovibrio marinus]
MSGKPKAYDAARAEAKRYPGERLVLILFFVFMLAPLAANLLGLEFFTDNFEKRTKATFPPFNLQDKNIYRFPTRFNEYFNDHFGLRDVMIRGYVTLKKDVMHATQINKVILGEGKWLYFKYETPDGDPIATYMGTNLMTGRELRLYTKVLNSWNDWMKEKGVPMLLMIPPDKESIYPEYLPPQVKKVRDYNRTDQILDALKKDTTFPVVNPCPALLEHKKEPLFLHTDTHWTSLGAFFGYQQFMKTAATLLPQWNLRIPERDDFKWTLVPYPSGDLGRMLMNFDPKLDRNLAFEPKPIAKREGPKPKLLFFGDSFSWGLMPYLKLQFEVHRIALEDAVYKTTFEDVLPSSFLESFKPDLFMFEVVERNAHILKTIGVEQ